MKVRQLIKNTILSSILCFACFGAAFGQTTDFTYQGRFTDSGQAQPTNGTYQMQFALFDAGGNQIGATITNQTVQVVNGIFTVSLDFGTNSFSGASRFLQVSVFSTATNAYVALTPRQPVTSAPYAVKSLSANTAETANNSNNLGGIAANQYVLTNDSRLSDDRNPTAGSGFYIQNSNSVQPSASFNISGNGTAGGTLSGNVVNSATQYNIGNSRVLSVTGTDNVFVGANAGASNTTGSTNSFFGKNAGEANTSGTGNSFFGKNAGRFNTIGLNNSFYGINAGEANTTGGFNSFFGKSAGGQNSDGYANSFFGNSAGESNTTANDNSFFGNAAGQSNQTGFENSFFGSYAGAATISNYNSFFGAGTGSRNTTGFRNAFFGRVAGYGNITGNGNSIFGDGAGYYSVTGSDNVFIGRDAGGTNTSGSNNTVVGANSNVGAVNLNFATAIGAGAVVSTSNTIVLGRANNDDTVQIPGTLQIITLGGGGSTQLCRNGNNRVGACSSSLRYKTNIAPFNFGLNLVNRLRPITFDWKEGGMHDLGLGAEDVAEIEPLLVTYNQDGQVEGVKYDRIGVVLLNAVKEQQAQIEALKQQIELLKTLVCAQNPQAEICK
jgi:hypothetical protein